MKTIVCGAENAYHNGLRPLHFHPFPGKHVRQSFQVNKTLFSATGKHRQRLESARLVFVTKKNSVKRAHNLKI